MNDLFEQMTNISKAAGFDVLAEQVAELKKENAKLREALTHYLNGFGETFEREIKAREALKTTKFS